MAHDPLDAATVRDALRGVTFGDARVVASTGSTNADVLALARDGAAEGVVLVADHQSAGRGRLGRSWEAPPGASLLLSILCRPSSGDVVLTNDEVHLVTMAVGVAAAEAVRAATGADVRLKWPNDLVVETADGTRKLSGILSESIVEGGRVTALVVGIGINVNWPVEVPAELADIAIAANHVAGHDLARADILVALLRAFSASYAGLATPEGKAALLGRYRELSATLGRRVRVELAGETIVGDAVDLTLEGHLQVLDECPDRLREISAGDVIHLRPNP
jgi:BirA family biotin operon repressor/biotin-[acetyl-CoA-carboxylase] ligase